MRSNNIERAMILEDLETDRLRFDPKDDDFIKKMQVALPELKQFRTQPLPIKQTYAYISQMYDPNSPIVESEDDYWKRKFECVETAGFKQDKDGKYEKHVEEMILGQKDHINDIIVSFIAFMGKPKWNQLIFFQETLCNYTKRSGRGEELSSSDIKVVDDLFGKINKVQNELLIKGDETIDFLNRFYYRIERARLALRSEDYARRISDGDDLNEDNPYGTDYKIEPITFVGEAKPKKGNGKRTKGRVSRG